jgi:hypothetical protein
MSPLCEWLRRRFGWERPDLEAERVLITKPAEDLEAALAAQRMRLERLKRSGVIDGA